MFLYLNRKGQSTLEYAVVIAIIVAGLIAMQAYIKRGVQGRLRQASDDIGEQYSPGQTTSNIFTSSSVNTIENIAPVTTTVGGDTVGQTTTNSNQSQNRNVSENLATFNQEQWNRW